MSEPMLPTVQLPYFRNPNQLPRALPTTKDIKAGCVVPTNRENFISGDRGHVVVVGDCFLVKYGPYIRENEGYALLFLEKYPFIPAPQLYAMYREDGILYLVMQFIPGRSLLSVWEELSESQKIYICDQLRGIFTQLRSIPSPGIFGDCIGGPLPHLLFRWLDGGERICGPFKTLKDLHMGLAIHAEKQQLRNNRHPWSSEWFMRHLPQVIQDHPSVFTHCDLVKQNIIVQEQVDNDGNTEKLFKVTGIVDWELAGWYPRYWEYGILFANLLWDDWNARVETFIDPFPLEAAMLRLIKADIEGF